MKKITDNFVPAPGPAGMGPPLVSMAPTPEPPLEDILCLKGPCQQLWKIQTSFSHGNTAGTFAPGEEPRHNQMACLAGLEEMDLEGGCVYECSRWSPSTEEEVQELEARRETYRARVAREEAANEPWDMEKEGETP